MTCLPPSSSPLDGRDLDSGITQMRDDCTNPHEPAEMQGVRAAEDEALDELFEVALRSAESGDAFDLDGWLAGREHLRPSAEQSVALARDVAVLSQRSPPVEDFAIPGYAIVRELGRGGMGHVYLARQQSLGGRFVALKVLPESLARSHRARRRFLTE